MKNLQWFEMIGPIITAAIGILALTGNSFNENESWYKKLNRRGYAIAILVIISVVVSLIETSSVNIQNDDKQFVEKGRYDSLSMKYDTLEARYNKIYEKLTAVDTTKNITMLQNLYHENGVNIDLANRIAFKTLDELTNSQIHFPEFYNDFLKDAQSFLMSKDVEINILQVITEIDEMNREIRSIQKFIDSIDSKREIITRIYYKSIKLRFDLVMLNIKVEKLLLEYNVDIMPDYSELES